MYNLVFWTGSVNFHNIQTLDHFGKNNNVIIAYHNRSFRDLTNVPVNNCSLVQLESKDDYIHLINQTAHYIHVNNAFKVHQGHEIIQAALKELVKRKYHLISLFQEQFPSNGILGWLRRFKWFWIYHFGLGRTHKAIGYCGLNAYTSLKRALVSTDLLHDFIYTPWYTKKLPPKMNKSITFIMVGQLVPRKAVIETINTFKSIHQNFIFKIIGDGVLKEPIKNLISDDPRFQYLGSLPPHAVQEQYNYSDILILSSSFDGWGCSTNEAISQGCKVIVSTACGSHVLTNYIPNSGYTFRYGDWHSLRQIAIKVINNGPLSIAEKKQIIKNALVLKPEVEACYLKELLDFSFKKIQPKPIAPWSKK